MNKKEKQRLNAIYAALILFILVMGVFLLYLSLDWFIEIKQNEKDKKATEIESLLKELEATPSRQPKTPPHQPKTPPHQPKIKVTPEVKIPAKVMPIAEPRVETGRKKKILYLVLDDCGLSVKQVEKFLAIPIEITYAVIPFLTESEGVAKRVHAAGREVIVHQPMQPLGSQNPGEGCIFTTDTKGVIIEKLRSALDHVPFAVGINNHMGSKATSNTAVMNVVLPFLKERELFFLDSKTTGAVVGKEIAKKVGTQYLQRNAMFLDNEKNKDKILEAIKSGLETANRNGHAVMIGHALTNELAEALFEIYPEILEEGYEFDRLSSYFTGEFEE